MQDFNCLLCGNECKTIDLRPGITLLRKECQICGDYVIGLNYFTIEDAIQKKVLPGKWILSGLARYLKDNDMEPLDICNFDKTNLTLSQIKIPQTPLEKIDMLLNHFYKESDHFDAPVLFSSDNQYPVCFAKNPNEMNGLCEAAKKLGYISVPTGLDEMDKEIGMLHVLTLKGWEHVDELRKIKPFGNQCFVAMFFDKDMIPIWENGILPAIIDESVKLDPMKIDLKEHNNHIPVEILSEIKKSKILIADFTHNRGGVYFEAGFARGLNIEVIQLCREDFRKELHFDLNQINTIFYNTPDDLKDKLVKRLKATINIIER